MPDSRGRSVPFYQQVANILRARIIAQESDEPQRLSTEQELCQVHRVSRITVRKALDILQSEGLIQRTPGRGTTTVPAGIRAWHRLRKARIIRVVTSLDEQVDAPVGFYGTTHQGIYTRAEEMGYSVSFKRVTGKFHDPADPGHYLRPEDPSDVVGVLLSGVFDDQVIGMHVDAGYPVVCVDYWARNGKADSIVFDCFSEGFQSVEYLAGLGHRTFFYVGNQVGPEEGIQNEPDAELVLAGMRRGLTLLGGSMPGSHVRFVSGSRSRVEEIVDWYLSLNPRPSAGFIYSMDIVEHFCEAIKARGLSCPRDVSLITKTFSGQSYRVACVVGDAFGMGQMAVDMLLQRAGDTRQSAVHVAIPSELRPGVTASRVTI